MDEQGTPRKSLRGHVSPASSTPSPHVLRTRSTKGDTGSGKKKTAANATGTVSGTSAKKATSLQKDAEGNLIYKRRGSIGTRSTSSSTGKESSSKQTSTGRTHSTRLSTGSLKEPVTSKIETSKLRKRSTSLESEPSSETVPTPKKRKTGKMSDSKHDTYCWQCHSEGQAIACELCPRVYHTKCLGIEKEPNEDWICPECERTMRAECVDTRSQSLSMITVDQLCLLLKYSLTRMKCSGSEPFMKPVDTSQVTNYSDFVFNPLDLSTLEKNVKKKMYGSTEAFLADTKWILHNCIIFNGKHHKLTTVAKTIIKIARHEMNEIEICPDCYFNSCTKRGDNWFCEPCRVPHPLVWAKMRGYPFWPAKALRTVKDQVDCRFFGEHDRAWVHVSSVFLLSEECPVLTKKKTHGFDLSMEEVNLHIKRIKDKFGSFVYAPVRTPFSDTQKGSFDQKSKDGDSCSVKSEQDSDSVQGFMLEDKDFETGSDIHITGVPRKTPGMGRGAKTNVRKGMRKPVEKTQSIAYRTASALKSKYNRKSIITTRLAKAKGSSPSSAAKLGETGSDLVEASFEEALDDDEDADSDVVMENIEHVENVIKDDKKQEAIVIEDEAENSGIANKENINISSGEVISIDSDDVVNSSLDEANSKKIELDKSETASPNPEAEGTKAEESGIGNSKQIDNEMQKDDIDRFNLTKKIDQDEGEVNQDGEPMNVKPQEGKLEGYQGSLLQSDPKKNPLLAKLVESCKEKLGISDEEEILEKSQEEMVDDEEEISDTETPENNKENTSDKDDVHLVTSTTVGSNVCIYCGVTFTSEAAVNFHVSAEHPPRRRYQCAMCRKEFSHRSHAVAHLKQSHKVVTDELGSFIVNIENSKKNQGKPDAEKEPAPDSLGSTQGTSLTPARGTNLTITHVTSLTPVRGTSLTPTQRTGVSPGQSTSLTPARGTAITPSQGTSLSENEGTSLIEGESTVVVDSDTDSCSVDEDSSQSDRLVIDLEKSMETSPKLNASMLALQEPGLLSEVRKKRKLTPPKTGKIVKRKSGSSMPGSGLYKSQTVQSVRDVYKISTGKETLKLSKGQLRMLEAAGKLKNPSWRDSQKAPGDKVTPTKPTPSVTGGIIGDKQTNTENSDVQPTEGGDKEVNTRMIDSSGEEPIDPLHCSSESDEEVRNYKLDMEKSVERIQEADDVEESPLKKPTSKPAASEVVAMGNQKTTPGRRVSSDRENKVDDSVITVISPKKFDNPLSLQQKNNPRRPSSDIMPEECDARVVRELGTVKSIQSPEATENISKQKPDSVEGTSHQSGTANNAEGVSKNPVRASQVEEGECEMDVSAPDIVPEKTVRQESVTNTDKDSDAVEKVPQTTSSVENAEKQTTEPLTPDSANNRPTAHESLPDEGVTKDSPVTEPVSSSEKVTKDTGILSGVEMPTFEPINTADSVFDLNKYTAQMMDSVRDVMATMAKDLLAKQAGEALKSSFKLEIEKLKWKQEQELLEIKHNSAVNVAEVKSSFDKMMKKAITDQHKKLVEEKDAAVKETKKKQWCANCGDEAVFYCCWNTSYCDFPCQKEHWPNHMTACTQQSPGNTQSATHGNSHPATHSNQQNMAQSTAVTAQVDSWKEKARENLAHVLSKQAVSPLYTPASTVVPSAQIIANQGFSLPTSVVPATPQFITQPRPTLVHQLGGIGTVGPSFSVSHSSQSRDNSNPPPPIVMMQNRPPLTGVDIVSGPIFHPRSF